MDLANHIGENAMKFVTESGKPWTAALVIQVVITGIGLAALVLALVVCCS
jgi:hypothetical protein